MKKITREWIEKAEGDFATMERESRARKNPNFDAICFHSQQCAEKYFKARLIEADIDFPKTHDLCALLDLVVSVEPFWENFREDLAYLTDFAVFFRYPGESADKTSATASKKMCRKFRQAARITLGLPPKSI